MGKIVLNNLMRRPAQVCALLVSVLLSAGSLFALVLLYRSASEGADTAADRLGADIAVLPQGASRYLDERNRLFTGAPANVYMDAGVVDALQGAGRVNRSTAQLFCSSTKSDSCCSSAYAIVGVEPESDFVIGPWCDRAGASVADLAGNEAIIGSKVRDFDSGPVTIMGSEMVAVAALAETGTSLDNDIIVDIRTLRRMMEGSSGEHVADWDRYGSPANLISAVLVDADESAEDGLASIIAYRTGADVVVAGNSLAHAADSMKGAIALLAVVAALLALLMVFQLFAAYGNITWNRRGELGLYLALGSSRATVGLMIAAEVLIVVGCGAVVGCIGGFAVFCGLRETVSGLGGMPLVMPSGASSALLALLLVIAFLAIGILSVSSSLGKVNRLDPSIAMRRGGISARMG